MRKLMWFTVGFAAACCIGVYLIPWGRVSLAAAIAVLFVAAFGLCGAYYRSARPAIPISIGLLVGFIWISLFQAIYLAPIRALEDQNAQLTIHLSDYSWETEYGIGVEGYTQIDGKYYTVNAYINDQLSLKPGDTVIGTFRLRNTTGDADGETTYHMGKGIYLLAYPKGEIFCRNGTDIPWYGVPAWMRIQIQQMQAEIFPEDVLPFARALLLGDTELIDYETDTAFQTTGISHVIAVSGMHVSILFSMVYLLTGRKRVLSTLIGLPLLLLFAAVAGFTPSITRACIMQALMMLALLLGKEYDPPTALSFAALCILAGNPYAISSVGFQLSAGCMVGIFLFSSPIKEWFLGKCQYNKRKNKVKRTLSTLANSISISLSATLITTPLCAFYFGTVSLIGALTNLLTLWVITYIFYGIIAACCLGGVWIAFGKAMAWLVSWPIRFVLFAAKSLAAFPLAAVYTCSIYICIWLIGTYCLLIAFRFLRVKKPAVLACCMTLSLTLALLASWLEPLADDVRMTVLNVGQGQCILLQSEGKSYLIDCGGDHDETTADIAAQELLSKGICRLDGMILTHYDRDHAGGADFLLSRVPADSLYLPICADTDGCAQQLEDYAAGDVVLVDEMLVLHFGDATISLFPSKMQTTDNESGLAILFQRQDCDILITGDRSAASERELLRQIDLPQLEVLIVGHHGSKYSTCQQLLDAGNPKVAIISVGENSYGHPTDEVLQRLEDAGCMIYRTDLHGSVVYRS